MTRFFVALGVALLSCPGPAHAQNFETASVKRAAPGNGQSTGAILPQQDPAHIDYVGVALKSIISVAYDVAPEQIAGPRWLGDERYDVTATLPAGTSEADVPAILRRLLADRFGLTVHEQTKDRIGYVLLPGKGTLKIRASLDGRVATIDLMSDHLELNGYTMADFARFLAASTGRPVTDQTGIQGRYDIALFSSMADIQSVLIARTIQQLGLKLETRTLPVKVVVVDTVEKIPAGI